MRIKTYHRHNCAEQHSTHLQLARCIWPRGATVSGKGPYAMVRRCRDDCSACRSYGYLHVRLFQRQEEAEKLLNVACGHACTRNHEVVYLDLEGAVHQPFERTRHPRVTGRESDEKPTNHRWNTHRRRSPRRQRLEREHNTEVIFDPTPIGVELTLHADETNQPTGTQQR